MALGVAVSNAILLVSNAELIRGSADHQQRIGSQAATNRLRPILMTSMAMIAGMIPMSLGLGEGGKQTAPLAMAVIGGLLFSTFITLWLVPLVYDQLMGNQKASSISLDPNDKNSTDYDPIV
jgi:multidrug efflux pump subunit AcrB